jgi:hypothetical protein
MRLCARLAFFAVLFGLLISKVSAELLYYDPFNIGPGQYSLGPLAGQNPTIGPYPILSGPWQSTLETDGASVQAPTLEFPYVPVEGGSVIASGSSRTWRNLTNAWDATTVGTFYISFLMNFGGVGLTGQTHDDVGHRVLEMWSATGPAGNDSAMAMRIGYMSYNGNSISLPPSSAPLKVGLGIGTEQIIEGSGSFLENIGRTRLFVLKFTLSDQPASDTIQLYLDPMDTNEPIIPNAEFTNVDFTLGAISAAVQFAGSGTNTVLDEFRISSAWSWAVPRVPLTGACDELDEACYLSIVQNFHQLGISPGDGDLNGDGRIDLHDLRIWRDNRTDVLPEISNVPEPRGLIGGILAGLVAIGTRRKRRYNELANRICFAEFKYVATH